MTASAGTSKAFQPRPILFRELRIMRFDISQNPYQQAADKSCQATRKPEPIANAYFYYRATKSGLVVYNDLRF